MADLYEHPKPSPSPSSSSSGNSGFPLDRDDFSIFLHNLLQGSSASSSSSSIAPSAQAPFMSSKAKLHLPPFASSPPPPPPPVFSSPVEAAQAAAAAVPPEDLRLRSRSADISDSACLDRSGGFGYDSEGPEGIDVPLKPAPPRSSSKRSRAAEVHNLSEKRRRSKINEKMKALQMLIPNSNKTDKASMLDEAIEYLKQLQLQVQMLSMRNGLSLNSVYVPGVMQPVQLPQTGIGFEEENGLPTANRDFSANQGTSMQTFDIPNQCAPPNHSVAIPTITRVSNSEYSFGLEPSIPTHYGSFGPSTMSSKEVCREDTLPLLQLDMGIGGKNSS